MMRMLVKYTAYFELDDEGNEKDRSYYLSFARGEDVMDIPFESFSEMKNFLIKEKLQENIESSDFREKISIYDDVQEFFKDIDFLVINGNTIKADFSFLKDN